MDMKTRFIVHDIQKSISKRGLEVGGKVQQYVDSEVLRLTDPYVPMDTGQLKQSGTRHTKIGSGNVIYKTPYARKQYFHNKGNGLRGAYWFERMKADHRDNILKGAAEVAGGRSEKP